MQAHDCAYRYISAMPAKQLMLMQAHDCAYRYISAMPARHLTLMQAHDCAYRYISAMPARQLMLMYSFHFLGVLSAWKALRSVATVTGYAVPG